MVLVSKVTAPSRASTRPSMLAPVARVIDVRATIVPLNAEPAPIVALPPTCQKTLQGVAPPAKATLLRLAVVSVEPAWKIQTSLDVPASVNVPVRASEEAELYTPGVRVWPPRSPTTGMVGPLAAAAV